MEEDNQNKIKIEENKKRNPLKVIFSAATISFVWELFKIALIALVIVFPSDIFYFSHLL